MMPRSMGLVTAALAGAMVVAACGGSEDTAPATNGDAPRAQVAEWRIGEPILDVGVAEGKPELQLHRVSAVRRTADGGLVVVDRNDPHVRHFGADGSLLAWFGADGDGPGELRGTVSAAAVHGDTLVAFHGRGGSRLERFLLDGSYLGGEGVAPSEGPLAPIVVRSHIIAPNGMTEFNGAAVTALADRALPDTSVVVAYVRPASDGLLWVGRFYAPEGAERWQIVDGRGVTVAAVEVPPRFAIYDSGEGWVAGVFRDSMDVEHAQIRRLEGDLPAGAVRMAAGAPVPAAAAAGSPMDGEAVSTMESFLRNLVSLQELHYANPENGFSYASSPAALRMEAPEGYSFTIPAAHQTGWAALVRHDASGSACAISTGNVSLPGLQAGVVRCFGNSDGQPPSGSGR